MNNKNGITLMEVLIVIAMVAIISTMVFMMKRILLPKDGSKVETVTVIIEGCEYIKEPTWYSYTHKGNCTNSIHRLNQLN